MVEPRRAFQNRHEMEENGHKETIADDIMVRKDGTPELVSVLSPTSVAGEVFRAIRTSIALSSADASPKILLFTSCRPGEGKSIIANNMAVTLAQSSKKVVLIDADMRIPSVYQYFNISPLQPGLVDYLSNQRSLNEVMVDVETENLQVIPAGEHPPSPADLLDSHRMAELLQQLAEEYDYVLLDSPPVLPVTDAVILSRFVDATILVARAYQTPMPVIQETSDYLRGLGAKILGVVLNGIHREKADYYSKDMFRYYKSQDVEDNTTYLGRFLTKTQKSL